MIDIRKLKELVRLMVSSGLTELDLRDSEEQVTLRRQAAGSFVPANTGHVAAMPGVMHAPATLAAMESSDASASPEIDESDDAGLQRIESPMVGTFYTSPEPDAAPFVTVGTSIGPNSVVCVIEAMKIFNEIKAECSGTIRKVLVKNNQAVEFGQALFLVEPS